MLPEGVTKAIVHDAIDVNKVVFQAHAHVELRIFHIPVDDVEIGVWSDASFANAELRKTEEDTWFVLLMAGSRKTRGQAFLRGNGAVFGKNAK